MEVTSPPVLVIAWNRPAHAEAVMEAVRTARPKRVFLAVDGPNESARSGEIGRVQKTISTLEGAIDWPCEVSRRYSEENAGCRLGVSRAIDWFFESVDSGIILEDDCVPSPTFFPYCASLLERYRHDEQVMCISGDNSAHVPVPDGSDYAFIRYPQIWGWATWKRAWDRYDRNLDRYKLARQTDLWASIVPDDVERQTLERILDRLAAEGKPDTWDYQWVATLLLEHGLSVHPRENLVTNIGFGPEATHTRNPEEARSGVRAVESFSFTYRDVVALDVEVSHSLFMATQVAKRPLVDRPRAGSRGRAVSLLVRAWTTLPSGCKALIRPVLGGRGLR